MNAINTTVLKNKCLVLGGSGFIGGHLIENLLSHEFDVRALVRPEKKNTIVERFGNHDALEVLVGDFTNENDLKVAIEGVDRIFHLVSTTNPSSSNQNPVYDIESNLIATVKLLELIKTKENVKLVFISSGGTVYGVPKNIPISENHPKNPICSYGVVKVAIENYLKLYHHLYGLNYTILRVSNPYGEYQLSDSSQGVVAVFMNSLIMSRDIQIWGDGSVARDFIYIGDVINATVLAMEYKGPEKVFNVGSGVAVDLNKLIKLIQSVSERTSNVEYNKGRKLDVPVSCLDTSLAESQLGWQPEIDLSNGLKRTWNWMQGNYES